MAAPTRAGELAALAYEASALLAHSAQAAPELRQAQAAVEALAKRVTDELARMDLEREQHRTEVAKLHFAHRAAVQHGMKFEARAAALQLELDQLQAQKPDEADQATSAGEPDDPTDPLDTTLDASGHQNPGWLAAAPASPQRERSLLAASLAEADQSLEPARGSAASAAALLRAKPEPCGEEEKPEPSQRGSGSSSSRRWSGGLAASHPALPPPSLKELIALKELEEERERELEAAAERRRADALEAEQEQEREKRRQVLLAEQRLAECDRRQRQRLRIREERLRAMKGQRRPRATSPDGRSGTRGCGYLSGQHEPDDKWRELTQELWECQSVTDVLDPPPAEPPKRMSKVAQAKTAAQVLVAAKRAEKLRLRAEENKKVGLDEFGKATSTLGPLAMQRQQQAKARQEKELAQARGDDPNDFPLKQLSEMPVVQAIRHALIARAGSLKDAWLQFDRNQNGTLDLDEFNEGMKQLRVPWGALTSCDKIEEVFAHFDVDNSGEVDLVEFLGFPDDLEGNWKTKDDDAKWRNYYTKVKLESPVLSRKAKFDRPPLLVQKILDTLALGKTVDNFEEQTRRAEVRKLGIAHPEMKCRHIGYHDMHQIRQVHLATKRELEERRLRSENGLKDLQNHRAAFEQMKRQIHEVTVETAAERDQRLQAEAKERQREVMQAAGSAGKDGGPPKSLLAKSIGPQAPRGDELISYFHLEVLDLHEDDVALRDLAVKLDLPITDVEKYAAMFAKYDTDGSGEIEKDEFGQMMQDLLCRGKCKDQELPKALLNDYWMSIDRDGSGAVDRDEFVEWYCLVFLADRGPKGLGDPMLVSQGDTAMTVRRPGLGA